MYPRISDAFMGEMFICRSLYIEDNGVIHLRLRQMEGASNALSVFLYNLYIAREARPFNMSDLLTKSMCVVARNGYAKRGEIKGWDSENGYSDILFVDTGDREYVELRHIYHPVSLITMMAVLQVPVELASIDTDSHTVVEIMRAACNGRTIMASVRSYEPVTVSLLTDELVDVAENVVVNLVGDNIGAVLNNLIGNHFDEIVDELIEDSAE